MKQSLQLKLSQSLTLTPQLQQSIKLLQLSTIELNQEIERFLAENPLLEREDGDDLPPPPRGEAVQEVTSPPDTPQEAERDGERDHEVDTSASDSADFSDSGDWGGGSSRSRDDEDDRDFQDVQAASTSLRDHLNQQISLSPMSDRDRLLARFIIEALDDDGYLHQSLEELIEVIPEGFEIELDDLQIALSQVQSLEPAGIAARTPAECLALQLRARPADATRDLALVIVREHLELLAERNFVRIRRATGCSEEALREAHALICSLNPHPGLQYGIDDTGYIVPDVMVRKVRNRWVASLNGEAMPRLRVNQLYASILQQNRGSGGALTGQLQEARWLIKNVQQRFDTILRVSQAIVDQQRQFFEYGDVAMRPLTLREIADELELHESTISRVTTQKYMATPRGVFELKYFFGSHVSTDTGGAASSTAIRALIRQLVEAEDKKKPLSDSRITELLGQQGIVVARRTIAKYRESLNIPPVSQRKSI
ncbi:MAG: RNA polymerase factor sigma-54 [Zoogloeaceae bacterium]|nr:RNA polymerase factor sigma-54 [Zoogloeaceae bacterium]